MIGFASPVQLHGTCTSGSDYLSSKSRFASLVLLHGTCTWGSRFTYVSINLVACFLRRKQCQHVLRLILLCIAFMATCSFYCLNLLSIRSVVPHFISRYCCFLSLLF